MRRTLPRCSALLKSDTCRQRRRSRGEFDPRPVWYCLRPMLQVLGSVVLGGLVLGAPLALVALWVAAGHRGVGLRAPVALLGFFTVMTGFLAMGVPLQSRSIIAGLWATEALAIALPAVAIIRGAGVRLAPYLGFRAPSGKALLVAAVAALANQPVVSLLTFAAHALLPGDWVADFDSKQQMLNDIFKGQAQAMVVTVAIAAPLGEELFFRGFALPALGRSMKLGWAVVLSGALFSLLHLDPIGFIGLWEIGVLLALLRIWSGSLWPAILAHATNNAIAGAAFLMGYEDPSAPPPLWFLLLGGALLAFGIFLATKVLQRGDPAAAGSEQPRAGVDDPGHFRLGRAGPLFTVWLIAFAAGTAMLVTSQRPRPAPAELPPQAAP